MVYVYTIGTTSIERESKSRWMIKYYNVSHSVPHFFRIVTVQIVLRIVTAVIIIKKHLWYRMRYIQIFNNLAEISNDANFE